MFLLDSLMIAGLRWTLETVVTAAEAEMNDDSALRERLLEAELQREMGEISDEDFAAIEADLLQAMRAIKERREGGSGPVVLAAQPLETDGESRFQIEAEVSGDFHNAPDTHPHTDVITITPDAVEEVVVTPQVRSERSDRSARSDRSNRSLRTTRTRTTRTSRTTRTTRTIRTPRSK